MNGNSRRVTIAGLTKIGMICKQVVCMKISTLVTRSRPQFNPAEFSPGELQIIN